MRYRGLLLGLLSTVTCAILSTETGTAASFQDEIDRICGSEEINCFENGAAGPAAGAGGQPSVTEPSSAAARSAIQRRLKQLECPTEDCPEAESVGAESLGTGLGMFVSFDYENKDRDETEFEAGYDSDRYTGTIGIDYRLTPSAVLGIALSYGRTNGDFDNDGGDFDKNTFGGNLYASFLPIENGFVDVIVGYTRSDYDYTRTVVAFDTEIGDADGDANEHEYIASVTGGYDFFFGPVTAGPRLGIAYKRTTLDNFSENGDTPLNLDYDSRAETSLTSALGVQASYAVSTGFGVIVPQVNADWVHEFENDAEEVDATVVGTTTDIEFRTDTPDRNYYNIGASVTAILPNGWAPFASYSTQLGNSLETTHAVAIGLRLEL
jgi:outer membrane autotransporter protein